MGAYLPSQLFTEPTEARGDGAEGGAFPPFVLCFLFQNLRGDSSPATSQEGGRGAGHSPSAALTLRVCILIQNIPWAAPRSKGLPEAHL